MRTLQLKGSDGILMREVAGGIQAGEREKQRKKIEEDVTSKQTTGKREARLALADLRFREDRFRKFYQAIAGIQETWKRPERYCQLNVWSLFAETPGVHAQMQVRTT